VQVGEALITLVDNLRRNSPLTSLFSDRFSRFGVAAFTCAPVVDLEVGHI
jgi:hypothetical protein